MISASDTIRVGIIGCGGIANGKHMPSLKKVPGVEMVAFCDIVPERAQSAAKNFGTPDAKWYENYKELLADPTIDVVHVCTPNRAHSFITVDALDAGKHVMCEKPMAINTAEAKKMLDAAERSGKMLTIGYQNRYLPEVQYLKQEAEAGTFGDIYYAKATALRRRAVPTWGVFLNEQEQGGGSLIDIGTHALDMTLWVMDNYKPKYCVGTTYHKLNNLEPKDQGNAWGVWDPKAFTVEDSAFGFVVMENGATINLESAWALNYRNPIEAVTTVCGTKAGADMIDGLTINSVHNGRQCIFKPSFSAGGAAFYAGVASNDPSVASMLDWIDALRNNRTPTVSAKQAFCITQILEGIYLSSQNGDIFRF